MKNQKNKEEKERIPGGMKKKKKKKTKKTDTTLLSTFPPFRRCMIDGISRPSIRVIRTRKRIRMESLSGCRFLGRLTTDHGLRIFGREK